MSDLVDVPAAIAGQRSDYMLPGFWDALSSSLRTRFVPHVASDARRLTCTPGLPWRARLVDHVVWVVASGRGQAVVEAGRLPLRSGTALVLRPGDTVTVQSDHGSRLTALYAHFTFDAADGGVAGPSPDPTPPRFVQLVEPSDVHRRLREIVRDARCGDPPSHVSADLLLAAVLVELHRQAARTAGFRGPEPAAGIDPRIRRVIGGLRADPAVRVEHQRAARWAGLSPAYFGRVFARSTGRSYRDFCLDLRMHRAEQLLADTSHSVTEVAAILGYDDSRLFIRQFRDRYGLPPGRWRSKHA